jgi:hypothetical protein
MPAPLLVGKTLLARRYVVPLTRCYVLVEHARSLKADGIDWGSPMISGADFDASRSIFKLDLLVPPTGISVAVTELDVRVIVSSEEAGRIDRRVLRGSTRNLTAGLRVPSDQQAASRRMGHSALLALEEEPTPAFRLIIGQKAALSLVFPMLRVAPATWLSH